MQLAALTSLHRLRLAWFEGGRRRWKALTTLTTLRTLELDHCKWVAREAGSCQRHSGVHDTNCVVRDGERFAGG